MNRWLHGTWAVLEKDLRLELRARYAVNMLLMFVVSALMVVVLSIGRSPVGPEVKTGLLWIVVIFAATVGLGRSFVAEEEERTAMLLRLNVRGSMVYAGKLAFNFLLLLIVDLIAAMGFGVLLNLGVVDLALFSVVLVTGSLGLAGATTLLSAIIARASNRGPLLPVLVFPILFPLLLTVVPAARAALDGGAGWAGAVGDLRVLVAYAGTIITGAVLLFDHIWED